MPDDPKDPKDLIPSLLAQDDASFEDIVEEFVGGLGQRLEAINEAMDNGNFEQVRVLAHQLKGSASGYGYPILTQKAAELERLAIAAEVEPINASIKELSSLVARVVIRF